MTDWITDHLPTKSGDYLVTTKAGFVCIAKFWVGLNENHWTGRFRNCVIAWRDVPERFKEMSK